MSEKKKAKKPRIHHAGGGWYIIPGGKKVRGKAQAQAAAEEMVYTGTVRPKLNDKQKRFVLEYVIDLNATQAAIRAGYSRKTAGTIGHELLKKPEIQEAIRKAKAERAERTKITADRVLTELARVGFANIKEHVRWSENMVEKYEPSDLLADAQTATISQVESETTTRIYEDGTEDVRHKMKLKHHDKVAALKEMGKHLGISEKIDLTTHDEDDNLSDAELAQKARMLATLLDGKE